MRYVAGYSAKYGEAITESSLDVHTSSVHTALALARTWKAAAPEQILTLAREAMAFTSMTTTSYRPGSF